MIYVVIIAAIIIAVSLLSKQKEVVETKKHFVAQGGLHSKFPNFCLLMESQYGMDLCKETGNEFAYQKKQIFNDQRGILIVGIRINYTNELELFSEFIDSFGKKTKGMPVVNFYDFSYEGFKQLVSKHVGFNLSGSQSSDRIEGVFISKSDDDDSIDFVRFYYDRTVLTVPVKDETHNYNEVLKWFNKENINISRGMYTIERENIEFSSTDEVYGGTVRYSGKFLSNDEIIFHIKSFINGYETVENYKRIV